MSFSGKAYRILVDLVYEHSRIRLGADKQTLLTNRLQKRLRVLGLKSYDDYCVLLESPEGAEEIEELVDLISTNHTKFFREPDHFSFLVNRVLPALIPTLVSSRSPLRLWSTAASSGEEPYTMAIVVRNTYAHIRHSSGRSPPRISPGACSLTLDRASIEWMPSKRCPRIC